MFQNALRLAAKRYKQIVERPFQKINFASTTGLLLLTFLFSCGQRSGINNDETDDAKCGNITETKQIDVSLNQKGEKLFKQNCAVCHSAFTDADFNGPSLRGLKDRLPRPAEEWFIQYCLNSEKVFLSGDPYAAMLKDKYKNQPMTVFEGQLSESDVREIYNYLTN